jgi:hypothetical protein
MRRTAALVSAALITALALASVATADVPNQNWHVHSGQPGEAGLVFFPTIFGSGYATTPSLWAHCPNATDKALVGGTGGAHNVSGICLNELYVIHLVGVPSGAPAPEGWSIATVTATGFTVYYKLTPR